MKHLALAITIMATLLAFSAACKSSGQAAQLEPGRRLQPGQTLFSGGVSGGAAVPMPHPIAGFEVCTSCHYLGTTGAIHIVNEAHVCDECHVRSPMPPWEHGMPDDGACILCHQEAG